MINENPFSQDSRQQRLASLNEFGKTLKVTALPSYLLVCTALLLLGAFFVWGFLGTVSDKAYYSGELMNKTRMSVKNATLDH